MPRLLMCLFATAFFFAPISVEIRPIVGPGVRSAASMAFADDQKETTVYVTRTGEKYHKAGCRYLSKSKIPLPLAEAKKRYSACSVCKPPK